MKILILEDLMEHQIRIERALSQIAQELAIELDVRVTGKVNEFKHYIESGQINQLYFLDLDIKGDSQKGLEIAQFIRNYNPYAILVFVTTHSEFATMTFKYKVSALDFIGKDSDDTTFKEKLKDCILYTKEQLLENDKMLDYFEYSYGGHDVRLPYNDILYIETTGSSHKLRIVGKNFYKEFYGTIKDIEAQDKEKGKFFLPHKSFLANIQNIQDYDKKKREIIFYERYRCPISRIKVNQLKSLLGKQ
ncbi:competence system response regulator transcription factor ComE [Streptococcus oricebi]|uniref:DNA-binding response regulator n=1 Tax=Streptococcus oricebi TaxID=1547447 RepID=A0ABS5B5L4_9STRE|nr:competence system response regulator transcription factor ComE [Streptococcus oricebi]MBP2624115.1 DNA-binding response regulator [Streptococcus oricebi]